jgi:hypothetical protein
MPPMLLTAVRNCTHILARAMSSHGCAVQGGELQCCRANLGPIQVVTAKLLEEEPNGVLAAALERISQVRTSCAAELTVLLNRRADRNLRVIGFQWEGQGAF